MDFELVRRADTLEDDLDLGGEGGEVGGGGGLKCAEREERATCLSADITREKTQSVYTSTPSLFHKVLSGGP